MNLTFDNTQSEILSEAAIPSLQNESSQILVLSHSSCKSKTCLQRADQDTSTIKQESHEKLDNCVKVFANRAHDDDESESLPDLLSAQDSVRQKNTKPWVIILGRGNSFSLGRSEVILIHTKTDKCPVRSNINYSGNSLVVDLLKKCECGNISHQICGNCSHLCPAFPHLNGLSLDVGRVTMGCNDSVDTDGIETSCNAVSDTLEEMWHATEEIMVTKEQSVMQILSEYGLRKGGDGSQDNFEKSNQEEWVWEAVEVNVDRITEEAKLWEAVEVKAKNMVMDKKLQNIMRINVDRLAEEEKVWKLVESSVDRVTEVKKSRVGSDGKCK